VNRIRRPRNHGVLLIAALAIIWNFDALMRSEPHPGQNCPFALKPPFLSLSNPR
jgi:hypothetical protein